VNLNDNDNKAWAIGNFNNLTLNFTSDNKDIKGQIVCNSMKLINLKESICQEVITFDNNGNSFECSILIPFAPKVTYTEIIGS